MAEIWEVLTTVLVGFLILDFLTLLWSSRHYPPGPLPLPLIGGLWRIGTKLSKDTFTKLSKQYGDIYTVWLWHQPAVVISGFHAVKESLINHSQDFADRPLSSFLLKIFKGKGCEILLGSHQWWVAPGSDHFARTDSKTGRRPHPLPRMSSSAICAMPLRTGSKGISFSNGHNWKEQRRFTINALRMLGLGKTDMESKLEQVAHRLVETFARAKGQPIDPLPSINNSICNMICLLSFGYRFPPEDTKFQMILEYLSNFSKFGGSAFLLLSELFPWLVRHLPGPHQKIQASIQTGISIVKEESEKHSQDLALRQPEDFLDLYLLQIGKKQSDPNSTFDHENMAVCIMEFFAAGTETTGSFLQWALFLMVTYPDIQDKVYKEMETVLGSSDSICYEDRWKLPYTQAVLHEILRSKYVFIGTPRKTVKNVNVCGLSIPKGTLILADFRSVLMDPKQWESPEKFNPNHFLDKEGNFMKREEFLPFGAGARACVGENFARMESFLLFTNLLRSFKLQLPEGVKELNQEPLVGITLHSQPFKLCAVPRCRSS